MRIEAGHELLHVFARLFFQFIEGAADEMLFVGDRVDHQPIKGSVLAAGIADDAQEMHHGLARRFGVVIETDAVLGGGHTFLLILLSRKVAARLILSHRRRRIYRAAVLVIDDFGRVKTFTLSVIAEWHSGEPSAPVAAAWAAHTGTPHLGQRGFLSRVVKRHTE